MPEAGDVGKLLGAKSISVGELALEVAARPAGLLRQCVDAGAGRVVQLIQQCVEPASAAVFMPA